MSIRRHEELLGMQQVGRVVAEALREMRAALRPGVTTAELDDLGAVVLARHGARSAPQMLYGYPRHMCISLNDEAVHGIPGRRVLREGDLVKLDVTAELNGYIADAAVTVALPPVSLQARQLCEAARSALRKALAVARAGQPLNRIGRTVEGEVRREGFAVIRELRGHGVGRAIHEEPTVPNFYDRSLKQRLTEGLVLTIEPIIAAGSGRVGMDPDGWTVRTVDGSLSAHFEHTIMITRGRPMVLTAA